MKALPKKIIVTQHLNPHHGDPNKSVDMFIYKVENAVNTVEYGIGQMLSKSELGMIIESGKVAVDIRKAK